MFRARLEPRWSVSIALTCAICSLEAPRNRSRMIGQSGVLSVLGITSSSLTPIAFDSRRSSMIETLPVPPSICAM